MLKATQDGDSDIDDWSLDEPPRTWRSILATVPALSGGLIPVGMCPVCMSATVSVFSSLGLGFLLDSYYLLPLMGGFLGLALLTLGYKAKSRRGFGPLVTGTFSAVTILLGKFVLASDLFLYLARHRRFNGCGSLERVA